MSDPFQIEVFRGRNKDLRLGGYSRRNLDGEDGLFNVASGETMISPINIKKIYLFYIFLSIIFIIFLGRIFYWQIIRGDYYSLVAQGRGGRTEVIQASRGVFYDRHKNLLVKNSPSFSLNIIPSQWTYHRNDDLLTQIKRFLNPSQQSRLNTELTKLPAYAIESIPLINDLSYEQAILLYNQVNQGQIFEVRVNNQRVYFDPLAFSHVLGYLGKISKEELLKSNNYLFDDLIGRGGLESYYESSLRGKNGQRRIDIDSRGEEVEVYNKPSVAGNNIVLTIDRELQKKLYYSLSAYVQQNNGRGGAAIVMDPNSGAILAIVSYPSFNNTLFSGGLTADEFNQIYNNPNRPLFFRTISGEYPPGSTIKPVLAVAALEEKIITSATTIISSGGVSLGNWFFADWKQGGHGITNVIKALSESVNTFFYYIGGGYNNFKGLGVDKIDQWLAKFGLGTITKIDLAGEKSGFIPTPLWKKNIIKETWYPGDTYHLSIGQGDLLVTPLQVANYTSAIANNGVLYQPYLVKKVITSDGEIVLENEPKIFKKDIASLDSFQIVKSGMREAAVTGSARALSVLKIAVAGKTGTAQMAGSRPQAWFTGFAPYSNPEIVITVLIENGGEGSVAAVPVVKEVLDWWIENNNK